MRMLRLSVITVLLFLCSYSAKADDIYKKFFDFARYGGPDTPVIILKEQTLRFPIFDRYGDRFSANMSARRTFDFNDSSFLKQKVEYDPKTKSYYILEKIGSTYYRKPISLSFDEYLKLKGRQDEIAYFQKRSNTNFALNRKLDAKPKLKFFPNLFNRLFGGVNVGDGKSLIDIKPQGDVNITAGYQGQQINNPTLPERAQSNGGFDFNMNANVQILGNIGEKLKLPINYNTLANFDFENQLKLNYQGDADQILKSLEAGNLSFQTKGRLIPSAQNLFGVKTQLQFGKLFITAAVANSRSTRQSQNLQGGASTQLFDKKLDDYDENRNFLLGQYFVEKYNDALKTVPVITSQVQIQRMEVWVTNRNGATTDARDIVALQDLGEANPYNTNVPRFGASILPDNNANGLMSLLRSDTFFRDPTRVSSLLSARGLRPVEDFEKTFARKLNPSDYYFDPQVGFVLLNQQLQPDEVLGVAYAYTYNGRNFQVGEFSNNIGLDTNRSGVQKMLFLKLLKATSQRTNLPTWKLMMKNVYALDVLGIQQDGFKLNLLYQEPSGGEKRNLPVGNKPEEPLLRILGLDKLNSSSNSPSPDGIFDFLPNRTIFLQQGRIVFPVLEPFGRDLERLAFVGSSQAQKDSFVYRPLYDSIKAIAQTYANLNRYVLKGQAKSTTSSQIYLGAFNIPQGSVTLNAGGQLLTEGSDYTIDYNLGSVTILNQSILNTGVPVQVNYENNTGFQIQQRNFLGLRLDYNAINKQDQNLALGATIEHLGEQPFFTKVNAGEDPISNTMYGFDFTYRGNLPKLTKWLDKLPFYNTTTMSTITAFGEGALLSPGHPDQIGTDGNGLIYIDDFEGARNSIDLRFPFIAWNLASTPQGNSSFPEAALSNDTAYGKNRAKLAWYNIEQILQESGNTDNPTSEPDYKAPYIRRVFTNDLFPARSQTAFNGLLNTFDVAYYPKERGPYNFDAETNSVNADGTLKNPKTRWGGMMRNIDQTDFETGNVEFLEFLVLDPFLKSPNSIGGKLRINLGNISEDILRDGRRFYENGLPTPSQPGLSVDSTTVWGKTPINPIAITNAFSTDPNDRSSQDVGLDGINDFDERRKRAGYLNKLRANFGANSSAYINALNDPSNDNYTWYRDASFGRAGILPRYKNINNPQGNSPVSEVGSTLTAATTLYPDNEDLNRDNTLTENEEYFEYEIDMQPSQLRVGGNPYITDVIVPRNNPTEKWYLFRIPIQTGYKRKVGNIPDFKSIRFVRMYMTDFEDSAILRFAKLDLVRNQWRNFKFNLDTTGLYGPIVGVDHQQWDVLAVNVEENSARSPINYVIPPGIERVQQIASGGVNILQNEQSMSIKFRDIRPKEARAVFKSLNLDMRRYGRLSMFIHCETSPFAADPKLKDSSVNAIIRIGQDYVNNYYEIKIPLKVTTPGSGRLADTLVWPSTNNLDFSLRDLIDLKQNRDNSSAPIFKIYRQRKGNKTFSVMGNPTLGEVKGILFGVEHAGQNNLPVFGEVWINELRMSELDERGGWAAAGQVDIQLADLGRVAISANTYTAGFGSIDQRVNERAKEDLRQIDISASLALGKLLPKSLGIELPFQATYSNTVRTPEFDPYANDFNLVRKLDGITNQRVKDSVANTALDQQTTKTLSFTNVRVNNIKNKKIKPWSIYNFSVSYSYFKTEHSSPLIVQDDITRHHLTLNYAYSNPSPKYIEPFKKMIKSKSPWLTFLKDFNFNPVPNTLSFTADINRQFGEYIPRIVNTYDNKVEKSDTTYDKFYRFDRIYVMNWNLTRSLRFDFNAINNAIVDEADGRINTPAKEKQVRDNLFKGGRNTLYTHSGGLTYNLPTSKFPFLDWMNANLAYKATYTWTGANRLAFNLGNVIENKQDKTAQVNFEFATLYNKSKLLRALEQDGPSVRNTTKFETPKPNFKKYLPEDPAKIPTGAAYASLKKKYKLDLKAWRAQKKQFYQNREPYVSAPVKFVGRILTSLKRASINYTEGYTTQLPGWKDSTNVLGNNWNSWEPGFGFVTGEQPNRSWLDNAASKGLITNDSNFNVFFRQTYDQKFTLNAQLEPFREFIIDVNMEKTFSKNYNELFKSVDQSNNFQHLSPAAAGSFSVTYIAMQTLFGDEDPNKISETFKRFQDYRLILSQRLAAQNPNSQTIPGLGYPVRLTDGYYTGYSRYAQDVILPAFIAAYTNADPQKVSLVKQDNSSISSNPFSGITPLPNWRVTYTGLTRIPALAKIFNNINVSHAYNSTLSMNSFNSAINFADRFGYPAFFDTLSKDWIPFFLVPNVSLTEAFEPLFGIDVTTNDQLSIRFEYKKRRQLSLSLVDYQLSETRGTEWSIGATWRKKGLSIPFLKKLPSWLSKSGGNKIDNDMSFKLDIGVRDDYTVNVGLDKNTTIPTSGQKVITIQPSIDYVLSNRVNIKLFFDQRRVIPYTSQAPPITTTRAGLQLRISLAQ